MSKPDFVWHRGYLAGEAGLRPEENPYAQRDGRVDELRAFAWEDGRQAGEAQFLRDLQDMDKTTAFDQAIFVGAIAVVFIASCGIIGTLYYFFG